MLSILGSIAGFIFTAKFIVGLVVGAFVPAVKLYLLKAEAAAASQIKKI